MSGGHYEYLYCQIRDTYSGDFEDADMEALFDDMCDVLHDLEWYRSGDYGRGQYLIRIRDFKNKWLKGYDTETNSRIDRFKENFRKSMEEELNKL